MAIFKSKKKKESSEPEKKEEKIEKNEKKTAKKLPIAWKILKAPYVSEKATQMAKENKYVFQVSDKANKNEIKDSIKEIYKVDVVGVNVIKVFRKRKRLGKFQGWKKGFKKAVVQIKKGQKIDIYPS